MCCGPACVIKKGIYYETLKNICLGKNILLNRYLYIDAYEKITIADNVRFGPKVSIITGTHEIGPHTFRAGKTYGKPVLIEKGCWIGAGTLIGPGVTIGSGSIVAAGAVVMRSMPSNSMVMGNPARIVKKLD